MAKIRICSWNVNGIRAQIAKGFYDFIGKHPADIFIFQETKAGVEDVKKIASQIKGVRAYANEAEKKGYSGTAILTWCIPKNEFYGIGKKDHDGEGRITGLEFDDFFLINVYVPNSGSDLKRLDYRKTWDRDFLAFCKGLEKKKPVIIGGDFNVAHKAIDLARPKENYNKTSGYTQTEIDGMDAFTGAGFIDSFRHFNPDRVAYTFWNQRFNARAKNVGWRIDYFLVRSKIRDKMKSVGIQSEVMGSDHCPLSLEMAF